MPVACISEPYDGLDLEVNNDCIAGGSSKVMHPPTPLVQCMNRPHLSRALRIFGPSKHMAPRADVCSSFTSRVPPTLCSGDRCRAECNQPLVSSNPRLSGLGSLDIRGHRHHSRDCVSKLLSNPYNCFCGLHPLPLSYFLAGVLHAPVR